MYVTMVQSEQLYRHTRTDPQGIQTIHKNATTRTCYSNSNQYKATSSLNQIGVVFANGRDMRFENQPY